MTERERGGEGERERGRNANKTTVFCRSILLAYKEAKLILNYKQNYLKSIRDKFCPWKLFQQKILCTYCISTSNLHRYESCPRCRIAHLTRWPIVQHAISVTYPLPITRHTYVTKYRQRRFQTLISTRTVTYINKSYALASKFLFYHRKYFPLSKIFCSLYLLKNAVFIAVL